MRKQFVTYGPLDSTGITEPAISQMRPRNRKGYCESYYPDFRKGQHEKVSGILSMARNSS